jgi:hypothetical protein
LHQVSFETAATRIIQAMGFLADTSTGIGIYASWKAHHDPTVNKYIQLYQREALDATASPAFHRLRELPLIEIEELAELRGQLAGAVLADWARTFVAYSLPWQTALELFADPTWIVTFVSKEEQQEAQRRLNRRALTVQRGKPWATAIRSTTTDTLPQLQDVLKTAVRERVTESLIELGFVAATEIAQPLSNGKRSGRNYNAMGNEKLIKALRELRNDGAAAARCTAKGDDVIIDCMEVEEILFGRGIMPNEDL